MYICASEHERKREGELCAHVNVILNVCVKVQVYMYVYKSSVMTMGFKHKVNNLTKWHSHTTSRPTKSGPLWKA